MMKHESRRASVLVSMMLALSACRASEPPKPVPETQTNAQGCVRVRSTGPQDPAAVPVPIKQACVGPYLLELPQNYFDNQMGTEFDGSFALALEYPSLEAFLPGERSDLKLDVSTRTVAVSYHYIDRIDIHQAMGNTYTNTNYLPDDPAASLEGRQRGEPVDGLIPYYADMDRIREYHRRNGLPESAPGMQDNWNKDWFLKRGKNGDVETVIKCTSRNVVGTGVEYRDGKMVRNGVYGLPDCDHTFAISDHNTQVSINYVRVGLTDWQLIEDRARSIFLRSIRSSANADGGAHK